MALDLRELTPVDLSNAEAGDLIVVMARFWHKDAKGQVWLRDEEGPGQQQFTVPATWVISHSPGTAPPKPVSIGEMASGRTAGDAPREYEGEVVAIRGEEAVLLVNIWPSGKDSFLQIVTLASLKRLPHKKPAKPTTEAPCKECGSTDGVIHDNSAPDPCPVCGAEPGIPF